MGDRSGEGAVEGVGGGVCGLFVRATDSVLAGGGWAWGDVVGVGSIL